jgi:hypothetical protein
MHIHNFYPATSLQTILQETARTYTLIQDEDIDGVIQQYKALSTVLKVKKEEYRTILETDEGTHFFQVIDPKLAPEYFPYIWGQFREIPEWACLYRTIQIREYTHPLTKKKEKMMDVEFIDVDTFKKLCGPLRQDEKTRPHIGEELNND